MKIGTLEIGGNAPCAIIAEMSNAANKKLANALRIIDEVKAAGASAIKVQTYTVDEIIALRGDGPAPAQWSHLTMRELYKLAAPPTDFLPYMIARCNEVGLPWFSSVFGLESLAMLEALGCPAYKMASLDRHAAFLRDAIRATGKPLIMSAPTSYENTGKYFSFRHDTDALLLCVQGYPQSPPFFGARDLFVTTPGVGQGEYCDPEFDGFSYHGTDDFVPLTAATLGAKILEVHVQLGDARSELESNISLEMPQLADLVYKVRKMERMIA